MTADPDEHRGWALMNEAAPRIRDGVARLAAPWVFGQIVRIVDAWGRLDADRRAAVLEHARRAGDEAQARVLGRLDALFAADPGEQRSTPLEIVRTLRYEVTAVLERAGIPPVERDPFQERAFPDDAYGVVPHSMAELGDDDLGPMLMAWGLGKSKVLRARAESANSGSA